MKKLLTLILILGSIVSSAETIPIVTIPFLLEKNCIYMYCKVNNTDSLKFLFDTGADGSVINARSVHKLSLKIDGQSENKGSNGSNVVEQSSSNTVVIGGLITQSNVSLTIIPYETDQFDGVLGTNLMMQHIIEIDYDKNELRFYRTEDYRNNLSGYEKMKVHFVNNYPTVKCALIISGKKYEGLFGLDTGADDVLTIASPFASKNALNTKMQQIGAATSQGSDGSSYEMPIVLVPELTLGRKSFYRIPISLSASTEGIDASEKIAGFWGNNFLNRFNTVLNLKDGFIYFRPGRYLYTPFFK